MNLIKTQLSNTSVSLIIHRVMLGVLLLLGGALITTGWDNYRKESKIDELSSQVASQSRAIGERDTTIKVLKEQSELDDQSIHRLEEQRKRLEEDAFARRGKLRDLESRDEDTRKYLNTPIPDELARLLNAAPTAASAAGSDPTK